MNPLLYTPQSFFTLPHHLPRVYTTPRGTFTRSPLFFALSPWGLASQPLPPHFVSTPLTPQKPWVPRSSNSIQVPPYLVPNPCNDPRIPRVFWDVSQLPVTAKRLTSKGIIVDLEPQFNAEATSPGVPKVHIVCNVDIINRMWGPIIVKSSGTVKVWDVLIGIYRFLQTPLTADEINRITAPDKGNYDKIAKAMHRRCLREPCLPGWAQMEGLKRVDCLGDVTSFSGLQVVENPDNTWQLLLVMLPRQNA